MTKTPVNTSQTAESDLANARALEQIALSKLSPLKTESEVLPPPAKVEVHYHPAASKPLVLTANPGPGSPAVASPVPPLRPVSLILADKAETVQPLPMAQPKPDWAMGPPKPDLLSRVKMTLEDTNASIREQA